MSTISTKYNIGEAVKLKNLGVRGFVRSIAINKNDLGYWVQYMADAGVMDVYVLEDDLDPDVAP